MEIITYQPKSELLRQYIESFNVFEITSTHKSDVISFPHVNMGLSILQNSVLTNFGDNYYESYHSKGTPFWSGLAYGTNHPVHIKYSGPYKDITLGFKPLGINAFLENNFNTYVPKDYTKQFIPFSDYKVEMIKTLNEESIETQLEMLEAYWLSKLIGFDHPFLIKAISEMESNPDNFKVKTFASENHITSKTFICQFRKHLGRTPFQHLKILRFRNSIRLRQTKLSTTSLTSIALDSGYFDQSHFIRDFKNLTGKSPKDFFQSISDDNKSKIVNIIS